MRVATLAPVLAIAAAAWLTGDVAAQRGAPPSPYPITQGKVTRFEKVADGVYYATGAGGGNSPVVIGDRDVLVVDTNTTPAETRAFLEDLKLITNKPVRYAVNSHYHYDHSDGNQVYREIGADVVAHEFVKYAMENYDILHREPYMTSQVVNGQRRIDTAKQALAGETDPQKRGALASQLAAAEKHWVELQEIKVTPPNVTYKDTRTIDLGGREVQLLFLGRGHTNGDTFVYLPQEKIVCSGDMLESVPAYMGDAHFDEWIAALEKFKQLDFELTLPGHGVPFKDGRTHATAQQGYLRDIVKQVSEFRKQGMTAVEAAPKVDLSAYKANFPSAARPGAELRGVRHIYEWLYDQEHKK
jgi:glyoxylase-like metal-dependent hydrolase (beta-lactamase superfamily II)